MKRSLITLCAAAACLTSANAYAQSCSSVDAVGTAASRIILSRINDNVAGTRYRISRRKTLDVARASALSFDGCRATITLDVTLERKIRRDASGVVRISASVASIAGGRVCLSNAKVDDVDVSNTLAPGEFAYRVIAAKALPNNPCFDI